MSKDANKPRRGERAVYCVLSVKQLHKMLAIAERQLAEAGKPRSSDNRECVLIHGVFKSQKAYKVRERFQVSLDSLQSVYGEHHERF